MMPRWFGMLGVCLAGGLLWWAAADRRAADPAARVRAGALVATVAGTLPWVWMVLTPTSAPRRVQLDPVHGLTGVLTGDPGVAVVQVVGNLLVFAAFGAFAPLRWPRLGLWSVLGLAASGALLIEALQYVLDLGRVSATDDVLLNTLGAGLAYAMSRVLSRVLTRRLSR